MKLVRIDDVYINIDQVTSIEFEQVVGEIWINVFLSAGGSKTFYRNVPHGQTPSRTFDRFIDELRSWVEI